MKKSEQDEDDSWLDDEVIDEDEPPRKRPYLETSVSQLLSLAATSEAYVCEIKRQFPAKIVKSKNVCVASKHAKLKKIITIV